MYCSLCHRVLGERAGCLMIQTLKKNKRTGNEYMKKSRKTIEGSRERREQALGKREAYFLSHMHNVGKQTKPSLLSKVT